jgi:serine phosphatase RsbU (regulator of sigma subunit)
VSVRGTGLLGSSLVRIMLVEDSEADAFLVHELLSDAGVQFDLHWARTLAEAREVQPGDVDVVLLDLGLPDAEGFDALQHLRVSLPGVAVLVLTGLADEERGVHAMTAGAQDYLVKGQVDGKLLARSIRYSVERRRAESELRRLYAAELQAAENARLERGLLPQPHVADERLSVLSRYRPGGDAVLGGDFFDVVETPTGVLHALVGDVCGHGPDEAALGVALRIAWRALVLSGLDPDRLLPVLEEVLVRERRNDEVFATLCTVVIAPDRDEMLLYLAGHPAPLLLGETPAQVPADLAGPPLGVLPGVVWGRRAVPLGRLWRLMLFSDGLVEGRTGQDSERLGVEGLLALAGSSECYDDAGALADELIGTARALHGEPLPDDVAVLVLERRA